MPEKFQSATDLNLLQQAWAYAWVLLLSIWGGIVNFYRKIKMGEVKRFNLTELIGEMFTSGLSGVITYFFCQYAGIDPWLTAAMVGIAGHMGSRLIFRLEKYFEQRHLP